MHATLRVHVKPKTNKHGKSD